MSMQFADVAGRLGLVDAGGRPVPPERVITTTPRQLIASIEAAFAAGHRVGIADGAAAANQAAEGTIADVVDAVATAYSAAGMKAGAAAGVKAGAQWAFENSRVRRRIERGPDGEIVGTIEERVPDAQ